MRYDIDIYVVRRQKVGIRFWIGLRLDTPTFLETPNFPLCLLPCLRRGFILNTLRKIAKIYTMLHRI